MKFLFAHNNADLYGSSRSLLRLTSRLVLDGHDACVVLPFDGELGDALRAVGVRVDIMSGLAVIERSAFKSLTGFLSFGIRLPISVVRFWCLIRRVVPDVVHSNTSVMMVSALAGRFSKVRNIWHIREFYTDFPGFWKIYQQLMGFCSDTIICVSSAVQEQFVSKVRKKTVVLHNGFPLDEFEPILPERVSQFKASFGLQGKVLVGLVGRIILERKGHDVFVKAAALLKDRFPDVRFVVIGSCYPGNEYHLDDLNKLIDELGVRDAIVFTGDVEDVREAYAALDISVLASARPEPFGGVTIESMAFGKPVVGTNIGGTPEQIADRVTGLLIPPNDAKAMAEAIETLLENESLRTTMGEGGRKRFEERFTFEPFYKRLLENIYKVTPK